MNSLDIDPERTIALARELRTAAARTILSAHRLPPAPGPTATVAASLNSALQALERRSHTIAAHLDALSTDADTFIGNVRSADSSLGGSFGVTL